jgi:hypothetical protein
MKEELDTPAAIEKTFPRRCDQINDDATRRSEFAAVLKRDGIDV